MPTGIYPHRIIPKRTIIQPRGKAYRLIPLTQNQIAIVDVKDFDDLAQFNWSVKWEPRSKTYYARRASHGKTIYMHAQILGLTASEQADHHNHNGLDNRRRNLRRCSQSQNNWNTRGHRRGYKGVRWSKDRGKWHVRIQANGKTHCLGRFTDLRSAIRIYNKAARRLHGEFAVLNRLR